MTAVRTMVISGTVVATAILGACSGSPSPSPSAVAPKSQPAQPAKPAPVAQPAKPAPRITEKNPAGDIPDDQAFVAFSPAASGFSVKIPEGWSRSSAGKATSFTDKLNRIEVSTAAAASQPDVTTVSKNDAASLKAKVPVFSMGKVSSVVRKGGTAILLTYQGDSTKDDVTGKVVRDAFERYTFYKAGKRVDLTLSGPSNADNVDPWRIVSDSLRWG
ncbi:MAG: hypothetical protein QOF35_2203 [Actinomycetota bacterium]|jgi:hypothetical protein|nr:hypothetical protein [Actinomycetota bacterium]